MSSSTTWRRAELAVREFFQKERANFAAMRESVSLSHGLRAALYGRMITSYTEANIDASIHVAHAFTTHPQETENDYFSSVDDLNILDNTPGAAYTGNSQLTSGIFYGYVVVDVPALVQNLQAAPRQQWLEADRTMAGDIVQNLIMTIAVVSPGAKKGSTAPYSRAALMLVELGEEQPRSLAEAFRKPVRSGQTDDTVVALRARDAPDGPALRPGRSAPLRRGGPGRPSRRRGAHHAPAGRLGEGVHPSRGRARQRPVGPGRGRECDTS